MNSESFQTNKAKVGVGAIWARVSDSGQTSLPDQIARAKEMMGDAGYPVPSDRIVAVHWTSLDLFNCPQFLQLASWVRRREIQAIGMLDRDRLHSDPPYQRLAFLAECRQAGVEIKLCQGPPLIEGDWGDLLEHVYAIGKKQQVLRAKLGAKDGLHDMVVRDRKPTSRHRVYGYRWETATRLVPNDDWDTVKRILDWVLEGVSYGGIRKKLKRDGILSPKGSPEWEVSTISTIVRKPIYGGRYYALGKMVCEPTKRRGNTYGNSSSRTRPLDERIYLPEVVIVDPPITWEQYLQIQERVKRNQALAKRNSKCDYLLRGFIFCETHYGKNGKPRVYCGRLKGSKYTYICKICGYAHSLNGPEIEQTVKDFTWELLHLEPQQFYEVIANKQNKGQLQQSLQRELKSLEAKYNRNINAETDLEKRDLLGQVHAEVCRRIKAQLQAERIYIEERKQVIYTELAQLGRETEAIESLQQLRHSLKDRLTELSNEQWRQLFITLNMQIHVRDSNNLETWASPYWERYNLMSGDKTGIEISFGVPVKAEPVGEIVFKSPYPSTGPAHRLSDRHAVENRS